MDIESSSDDEYFDTMSDVDIVDTSDKDLKENNSESIETEIINSSDKIELATKNSIETDSQVPLNFNEMTLDLSDSSDSEIFLKEEKEVKVMEKEGKNQFDEETGEKLEEKRLGSEESEEKTRKEAEKNLREEETEGKIEENKFGNEESDEKTQEEAERKEREEREALLSPEERREKREAAIEMKESGNTSFRQEQFEEAVQQYSLALAECPLAFSEDRAVFLSNRAAALARLSREEDAIGDLTAAIALKPDYLKALLRRAELREKSDKLTEALEDYRAVLAIDPRNWSALHAQQTLPERIRIQQEKMKDEMINQLKQLGNLVLKPFGLSTDNFKMVQDPVSGGYSINFQNK